MISQEYNSFLAACKYFFAGSDNPMSLRAKIFHFFADFVGFAPGKHPFSEVNIQNELIQPGAWS